MNKRVIDALISRSNVPGERAGPHCPDEQILTAALDGEYRVIGRQDFEEHVSACSYCLAQMGRVARLRRHIGSVKVPEITMARAQRQRWSRPSVSRVPALAAAAMVGFAAILSVVWYVQSSELSSPETLAVPEVRNIDPDAYHPQILFPRDGTSVDPSNPGFRWTSVPGTLHYNVRIVSADGAVIWQDRVEEPEWQLPGHLRLAAGEDYYFRVDAYVTQAKSLGSRHVLFRVGKNE